MGGPVAARAHRRAHRHAAPDILCATEADREMLPGGGHVARCEALCDPVVVTARDVPGIGRQVIDHIDHIARSASVEVREVRGLDRHDAAGRPLSDHDAVVAAISAL